MDFPSPPLLFSLDIENPTEPCNLENIEMAPATINRNEIMFLAGIISALAFVIVLYKIGIRKCLGLDLYLDLFVTILLAAIFGGTYSGMMAAIIGGLVFSIVLMVLKQVHGYQKFTVHGWKDFPRNKAIDNFLTEIKK